MSSLSPCSAGPIHKPHLRLRTNGTVWVWMGPGWKCLGHIRDPKAKLYRRFGYGI